MSARHVLSPALSLGLVFSLAAPARGALKTGDPTPHFAVVDASGRDLGPAAMAGRVVVLNFWASWCAPCLEELPLLDGLNARIRADGGEVVAVNIDAARPSGEAVVRRLHLTLPVAYDGQGAVVAAFDPQALPTTYVLDRSGRVRAVHVGVLDAPAVQGIEAQVRALLAEPAAS